MSGVPVGVSGRSHEDSAHGSARTLLRMRRRDHTRSRELDRRGVRAAGRADRRGAGGRGAAGRRVRAAVDDAVRGNSIRRSRGGARRGRDVRDSGRGVGGGCDAATSDTDPRCPQFASGSPGPADTARRAPAARRRVRAPNTTGWCESIGDTEPSAVGGLDAARNPGASACATDRGSISAAPRCRTAASSTAGRTAGRAPSKAKAYATGDTTLDAAGRAAVNAATKPAAAAPSFAHARAPADQPVPRQ